MADLSINIKGDSSGAQEAFSEAGGAAGQLGDDVGKSAVKWQLLANMAETAARAVIKFGADSLKAYAESERVQKQLERAAGNYSGALDKQAQALSRLYAVDDDIIKQSQILLTQWGGVGAATNSVQEATLNLAAAMGGDLNSATTELIRNVESGGVGLGKLGVHFKVTGDKGKDLESAVDAINKKFGGAAGADAESLIGRTHAAQLAFEDLQKSIGGMLATALDKSGALGFITEKIREMTKGGEVLFEVLSKLPGMAGGVLRGNIDPQTAMDELKNTAINSFMGGPIASTPETPGVTGKTNKGMKDAAKADETARNERLEAIKAKAAELAEVTKKAVEDKRDAAAKEFSIDDDLVKSAVKSGNDRIAALQLQITKENKLYDEQVKYRDEAAAKMRKETDDANAEAAKHQEQQWRSAGAAIGNAFTSALSDQLSKLAAGEEFDVAVFVGDILASTIAIAATVIGTAYGQPELGAAVGNLAAMGVRAGAGAISANRKKGEKKHHEGGWVGDEIDVPRYHSGKWIGDDEERAILQHGERVLSRQEVGRMGGKNAVDAAVTGGRGVNVSIMAIDAKNAAESFMTDLGRGLKDALRSGQGDVPRLLGAGPR